MNVMSVDGCNVKIEYAPEIDMFGAEFKRSLAAFLDVCKEKGIEPRRNDSGDFNLRIPPELHERLAMAAKAEGKSIDTLAQEALAQRVAA